MGKPETKSIRRQNRVERNDAVALRISLIWIHML